MEKIDKSPQYEVAVKQERTLQSVEDIEEGINVELQEVETLEIKESVTDNTKSLDVLNSKIDDEGPSKVIKTPLEEINTDTVDQESKTEVIDVLEDEAESVEELESEKDDDVNRTKPRYCNVEYTVEKVQSSAEAQVLESEILHILEDGPANFETHGTEEVGVEDAKTPESKQDELVDTETQSSRKLRVEDEELCTKDQLQASEVLKVLVDEDEHIERLETEEAYAEDVKTPELQQSKLEDTDIQSPKEIRSEEERLYAKNQAQDSKVQKAEEYNIDIVKIGPEEGYIKSANSFESREIQLEHVEAQNAKEIKNQVLEIMAQEDDIAKVKTEPEKADMEDVNTTALQNMMEDLQAQKRNESALEEGVEYMVPAEDIGLKSELQEIEEVGEANDLTQAEEILEKSKKSTSENRTKDLNESENIPKELELEDSNKTFSPDGEVHSKRKKEDLIDKSNEIKINLVHENRDTKEHSNAIDKSNESKVVEPSQSGPPDLKEFIENGKGGDDIPEKNQEPPVNLKNQSSRPEKQKNKNNRVSIIKTRSASKNANELVKSETDTVKATELKSKDSPENSALLYVVKKVNPKPVETIELLDSDSEDDDVVIVSVSGLKRKPTTSKKLVSQKIKFPQPKVFQPRPSHIIVPQINQPMFAITSVKSINQSVSFANRPGLVIQPVVPKANSPSKLINHKPFSSTPTKRKNSESQSTGKPHSNKSKSSKTIRETFLDSSSSLDESTNDSVTNANVSIKDCQQTVEWVDNFVTNVLSPSQNVTPFGMELLQKTLDVNTYGTIKNVIEENKKKYNITSFELRNSVVHEDQRSQEMRGLFVKNNLLTDFGCKLATIAKQTSNRVYTTDRKSGQVTSKSRKKPKELEDAEYSPSIIVKFAEQTVADRRESLRRESKTNRKQYFAYEDDDDTEFLKMLEEQAQMEATSAKTKKKTRRRVNGSVDTPVRVKKMRLQEGFSVDTPFESDLLTPTWVEDSVGGHYPDTGTEQYFNLQSPEESREAEENLENTISQQMEEDDAYTSAALGLPFKNINRAHHCRSKFIDSCILCKVKHNFVVAHYVNQHRDSEVIISRLTQRDTDQLVKAVNCGYLITSKSSAHQYSATCVFCKREMKFALRYWWEHYTMHTGEYGYECSRCNIRRPRRQHAQRHANNECKMAQASVKVVYPFDKTKNQIVAYICKLCNYIQLHHENVMKHLRTQHEMKSKLNENIVKVILLQISRSGSSTGSFDYYENAGNSQYGENSYQNYDPNDENESPFMQYSDGTPQDDLSFMICGMLAIDDPSQVAETVCEAEDEMVPAQALEAQSGDTNS